jgi:hypothetical protein
MGRSENFSFEPENRSGAARTPQEDLVPELTLRATSARTASSERGTSERTASSERGARERTSLPELLIVQSMKTGGSEALESDFVRTEKPVRFGSNVVLDDNNKISKITYPAEGKTREFGRDENGEINKLVTTTPRGQYSYVKENGQWLYLAPDNKRYVAPDFSLDNNGEFSKVVRDGVVLTQPADGRSFQEERTALGARIQRDADGNPTEIKRPDNTMVTATYEDGRLTKLVDRADGQSTTWTRDSRGDWRSDDKPPQAVHNLRVEDNGNLSYSVDKVKYTIRGNGAEIAEGPGRAKYDFDDQGRISKIRYPGNKSSLSFGYMGSGDEPSFIQVDDFEKHQSKRYIHQPEKGGWTELDRNNNLLGTWKGTVKLNDDGTYAIKPTDGAMVTYLPDGTARKQQNRESARPDSERPDTQRPDTQRPDAQRPDARRPETPKPTNPDNINEITDHSVQLRGYMLPSPDQLGAGSCLYMSATGIAEYLINKSKGIVNPQVGGATDLSEQWTINLSKTVQLGNNYTDAPELLARAGALPDSRMKFKAYGSSSWMSERAIGGRGTETLPPYKKDVLFNGGGEGSQNAYGQMRPADMERIKKYLREQQSPVLFVYKPPTANWWHANIISGYNDKTQTFTVRDSSFGRQVSNVPAYNYDGRSPWGARPYRDQTEMPYYQVMQWGNHATGYRLAGS